MTRFQTELERSFVRAPFAGRVIDVRRRPGEIVGMEGVLELARVDQMQAVAEVFEADVRRVRVGQRARPVGQPGGHGRAVANLTNLQVEVEIGR